VETDEEDEQMRPEVVRKQIRQRRYEPVVRLEFATGGDHSIREMLRQRFDLNAEDIYDLPAELDYTALFQIAGLPIPALRDTPWTPLTPPAIQEGADIFSAIRAGDILVHHPYESFEDV
jgi:polyphosphate kinase